MCMGYVALDVGASVHINAVACNMLCSSSYCVQRGLIDMFKGLGFADYILNRLPEDSAAPQLKLEVSQGSLLAQQDTSCQNMGIYVCDFQLQVSLTPAFWGIKISNNFKEVAALLNKLRKLAFWSPLAKLPEFPATFDAVWCVLNPGTRVNSAKCSAVHATWSNCCCGRNCCCGAIAFNCVYRFGGSVCPKTVALGVDYTLGGAKKTTPVRQTIEVMGALLSQLAAPVTYLFDMEAYLHL